MKKYWEEYYKENSIEEKSSFADFCLPYINGKFIDLGCGNGRDLYYFLGEGRNGIGVDYAFEEMFVLKEDISKFIKKNKSYNYVYTRFLWHTIDRELQLKILEWVKEWLFIEARTTKDRKLYKNYKHKRNYVSVKQLLKDLEEHNFKVLKMKEGRGLSPRGKEDPHLIRLIARKWKKKL